MTPNPVRVEPGSIHQIRTLLDEHDPERILLVTGQASYEESGAKAALSDALGGVEHTRFHGFEPNPRLRDVREGIQSVHDVEPGLVIAVGGGSVVDVAKTMNVFAANEVDPREHVEHGTPLENPGAPLVAIPTTAGSGSEATQFAVLYIDEEKHSIDEPILRPDHVILDPDLTESMPPRLTAITGLDALCQAIESLWAVGATEPSRKHARRAARLAWENLPEAVHDGTPSARACMMEAAHLAGHAINVSRTTAPHAVSYTLTMQHGIPHGHAVALMLGEFIEYNANVTESDVLHPQGPKGVHGALEEILDILEARSSRKGHHVWTDFLDRLGLESSLNAIDLQDKEIEAVVDGVNVERARNNPRHVREDELENLLLRR